MFSVFMREESKKSLIPVASHPLSVFFLLDYAAFQYAWKNWIAPTLQDRGHSVEFKYCCVCMNTHILVSRFKDGTWRSCLGASEGKPPLSKTALNL
jgi:hypothetical protein